MDKFGSVVPNFVNSRANSNHGIHIFYDDPNCQKNAFVLKSNVTSNLIPKYVSQFFSGSENGIFYDNEKVTQYQYLGSVNMSARFETSYYMDIDAWEHLDCVAVPDDQQILGQYYEYQSLENLPKYPSPLKLKMAQQ